MLRSHLREGPVNTRERKDFFIVLWAMLGIVMTAGGLFLVLMEHLW